MSGELIEADLAALTEWDTPTICNALEIVAPERRAYGFNRRPLVAPFPEMKSVVGYARTAGIRAREPYGRGKEEGRAKRLHYYDYIAKGGPLPSLTVIQDLDGPDIGFGAFWGEVQTHVHQALGSIGTVTDGCVRDLDAIAKGFFVLAGSVTLARPCRARRFRRHGLDPRYDRPPQRPHPRRPPRRRRHPTCRREESAGRGAAPGAAREGAARRRQTPGLLGRGHPQGARRGGRDSLSGSCRAGLRPAGLNHEGTKDTKVRFPARRAAKNLSALRAFVVQ